jgi:hypothetical protein
MLQALYRVIMRTVAEKTQSVNRIIS